MGYVSYSSQEWRIIALIYTHIFRTREGKKFKTLLKQDTVKVLNNKLVAIQCFARASFARRALLEQQRKHLVTTKSFVINQASIILQRLIRRYIAQIRVTNIAKETYKKYLNVDDKCNYWHHPLSNNILWTKPKLLRHCDYDGVVVLEKWCEFIVKCAFCDKSATVQCLDCVEAFCKNCCVDEHARTKISGHSSILIPMCFICNLQQASNFCGICTSIHMKEMYFL